MANIWLFSELNLHFDEHSEKHPHVRKWAVQKTDTTMLLYAHPINDQGGLL